MADGVEIDFSDVLLLAASINEAAEGALGRVRQAVEVTARHVDDDWSEPLEGSRTVPGGPASITYDIEVSDDEVRAEIGPELTGQGPIVGMLEYGTPSTSPRGYGEAALEQNRSDFLRGIEIALDQAMREAGL